MFPDDLTARVGRWSTSALVISLPVTAIGTALALWYRSVTHRFVERSDTALDDLVPVPAAQHLVFRDVATWDGHSDDVRHHTSVEVRDGRVVAVREASEVLPAGAVVVEGQDKTLIPGLIDMHVHLMYDSGPDLLRRGPALMRAWMDTSTRYPQRRGDIVRRGQLKLKAG